LPPPELKPAWHDRGYLVHADWPGATQFITFRLADSLPPHLFDRWEARAEQDSEWTKVERLRDMEAELDAGWGKCWLRDARIAECVERALLHFDPERYGLVAWVVMPTHVHVVVRCEPRWRLSQIVHGWKWGTALAANRLLRRTGRFWQPEYFDRRVRDSDHLERCVRYVELNPVKAGLCVTPWEWPFGSARLRWRCDE
jgi:REP element-mobilizing transposase RayT